MPDMSAEEYEKHELKHYGIARRSGRYPWGSGGQWGTKGNSTPANRSMSFFEMVESLEAQGMSRPEIAKGLGFNSSTELRQAVTIANNAIRAADQDKAVKLRAKGWSHRAIGEAFDPPKNESSVRQLLDPSVRERTAALNSTADMLRAELEKGGYLDVGAGTEFYVNNGVSKERLASSIAILKDEGYSVLPVLVDQAGTTHKTKLKVLVPPGVEYKDVVQNKDLIRGLTEVSDDNGRSWTGKEPPLSISTDRIKVNYAEDGGAEADGVIYVRPGVKDVELGGSAYAQVRIDVEGTHYLKGMAVYKDDLPAGVDLVFNTNKARTGEKGIGDNPLKAMKEQQKLPDGSIDKDNPFGAQIRRQIGNIDPETGRMKEVTSVMNLISEEGDWDNWSRSLSSQVVSKQSTKLAEKLLDDTYARKKQSYDEIMALTNPTVKAKLLETFADEADASAVHLEAAGLPRSSYHVILPFSSIRDDQVYAPNFENGERIALIRYPHGGTFEIPELTVNNNIPEAKAAIGRAKDAVGINHRVAERMSGADFDGDFVMAIPNNNQTIKSTPALKQLEGFNPQSYKLPDSVPRMKPATKGKEMGDVSNLITDMTIKRASLEEISRAVRHSMVVIDAEKHHLDYKKSAQDFGIAALKEKYQKGPRSGADTLISLATSDEYVNKRRASRVDEGGPIDKATGKKNYTETGESYVDPTTGKTVFRKEKSTKLAETDDAYDLSSGTRMESVYAEHSNRLKALANSARREMVNTEPIRRSESAARVYKREVDELTARLNIARQNSPRERQAQLLTNTLVSQKKAEQPSMDAATLKKVKAQALAEARIRAGAKKELVEIEPRHWDAIQAGAISPSKLKAILNNTDIENVKALATPRPKILMSGANLSKAKAMQARGATQAEIARSLGVSLTTLKEGLG